MGISHRDHGPENIVPGLLPHHDRVGEHAAVPANVSEGLRQLAVFAVQPVTSVMRDGKLSVWIFGHAMVAGFVVCAGAVNGGVVLGDMKINCPGPERGRERFHRFVKAARVGPIPVGRQDGVFG